MTKAKWTVMVYMAAGDDAELDEHAIHDLQEMERARFGADVNVVVQINRFWPSKPQRYEIAHGEATLLRADIVADEDKEDKVAADKKATVRKAADEAVAAGQKPPDKPKDANMGRGSTLSNFMRWASERYEADRYFLVLWGHAYGLGFGRDHGDAMTLDELRSAIKLFNDERSPRNQKLELLGANACAISYAEAAYELREHVSYLVASQIAVPFAGWPYEWILSEIGGCKDPKEVGTLVVDRYVTHFAASPLDQQVAMTLLDLNQAGALKDKLRALVEALHNVVSGSDVAGGSSSVGHRLVHVRNAFLATPAGDVRPLIDLFDLCDELIYVAHDLTALEWAAGVAPASLAELTNAAAALRDYLTPALTQKVGEGMESEDFRNTPRAGAAGGGQGGTTLHSVVQWLMGLAVPLALKAGQAMVPGSTSGAVTESTPTPPLILFHKRHSGLNGLHGLGIFAPVVTDDRNLKRLELIDEKTTEEPTGRSRGPYEKLSLVKDSGWARLVFDDLRVGLPIEVVSGIEASGATSDADRIAITQMLASVDSVFATIDRRLVAARCTTLLGATPPVPPSRRTAPVWAAGPAANSSATKKDTATTQSPLGRLGRLRLMPREELAAVLEDAPNETLAAAGQTLPADSTKEPSMPSLDAGVRSLASLEKMLTDMERAVRRTLTHGTFGLGPSRLTIDLGKRDMGKRDMGKRDMGKRDMGKRDMGAPDMGKRDMGKRDMGPEIGVWVGTGTGEASTTPASIMADLFTQVGTALRRLEDATSDVELAAVRFLLGRRDVGQPGAADAAAQDRDDLERAFRIAFEASADARRTLRRVLADPSYGLGRGAEGVSTDDRSELARIGGLNGLELSLL